MLLDFLKKNRDKIARAAAEEIAEAHSRALPVYVEDPLEEGAVIELGPDRSVKKVAPSKNNAA